MDEEIFKSIYHRSEPVIKFNKNQTLYGAVKNANEGHLNAYYSSYFDRNQTFKDLINEVDRLSTSLHRDGVKSEDKIGVCMLTVPEVASILLSINKLGAVSFWLDGGLKPEDLLKYININNIKVLFLFEPLKPILDSVIDKTNLERVILVSPLEMVNKVKNNPINYGDDRYTSFSNYVNVLSDNSILAANYDKEKPSIIVQSSGSTGKSKSIVHTDYNFNSEIEKMSYTDLPFYRGKRAFVCAPPWVIYGLVNSIYSGLIFGSNTVYSLKPKEEMLYENIGMYDYAYGVPVYYRYLYNKMVELKDNNPSEYDYITYLLSKCNVFISGGDKISTDELLAWQHMFNVPIVNGYGNNEVVGAAIVSPMFANKPGTIGVPMRGNTVKAVDENGHILEDGLTGEIVINSDSLFSSYLNNSEETNNIKRMHDGKYYVHTGDIGFIDEDGYVHLTGRNKRLIIDKLGYKISPENSENVINSIPYVNECCTVGVTISDNNTVPMTFIELKDEYKGNEFVFDDIKKICESKLKEYERPKYYKEIEKIPHKENGGKVDFLCLEELAKGYIDEIKLILK